MSKNGMWVLKLKDVDISNFSNGQNDGCFVFQCIVISLNSMDWDLTWCVQKRQNGLNVCRVHNAIHLSNMIQGFNLKQYGITTGTSFITSLCKLLLKKRTRLWWFIYLIYGMYWIVRIYIKLIPPINQNQSIHGISSETPFLHLHYNFIAYRNTVKLSI